MKQKILIIVIILCSFTAGTFWAFLFSLISLWSVLETFDNPPTTQISSSNIENLESEITGTVKQVSQSIVSIVIKKDLVIYRSDPWGFFQRPAGSITRKVWGGSGFFISSNGIILTNKHVVSDKDAEYTVILYDGSEHNAQVLALDPVNDLAVIRIIDAQQEFLPLPIIEKSEIEIWQFAIAIGNALSEFQNSVSLWIISGKDRVLEAGNEVLSWLLQTDAAINPWNSGGPLLNIHGKVIGINTAISSYGEGIGFAIALTQEKVNYMLQSIAESWRIKRPFIGVNYILNSPGVAQELWLSSEYGIYIIDDPESVIQGSSADKAGLKPGDIIVKANDILITSQWVLSNITQNFIPGDIIKLEVVENSGKEKTIYLELWEY